METLELIEGTTSLRIEAGSSKSWLVMQRAGGTFRLDIAVEEDASLELAFIVLGDVCVANSLDVSLTGKGASCRLRGLWLLGGAADVKFDVRMNHEVPACTSEQMFKGILGGSARSNFFGLIKVAQDAQKTDARQQCHNLLLTGEARADARPQLEIYADDVVCTHGATVGRLDDDELFYMRSRGISLDEAKKIQLTVFAAAALDIVPEDVSAGLQGWIDAITL
ncbi:MAG: SufD family Fe-S cluster assembly protein [Bacteroidales bacterium]|nr:SufD family Fe-S cluster assembly protein [Bacteroidales bacterium]